MSPADPPRTYTKQSNWSDKKYCKKKKVKIEVQRSWITEITCKLTKPLTLRRIPWWDTEDESFTIILPSSGSWTSKFLSKNIKGS